MLRILALVLAVSCVAPSSAQAVIGEEIVPYRDADDGVTVTVAGGVATVRLDRSASASAVWRRLAGRRVTVSCGVAGSGLVTGERVRARHRLIRLADVRADVCTVSTRGRRASGCVVDELARGRCVRLVVAMTDAGREHVDEAIASWDLLTVAGGVTEDGGAADFAPLQEALGERLVQLPTADSTPPAGAIGYWTDGAEDVAIVVLTAAGERRFMSFIDGVTATNARDVVDVKPPSLVP
jgi:hypothetical protein